MTPATKILPAYDSCGGLICQNLSTARERAKSGSIWNHGTYSVYRWKAEGFLVINGVWQGISPRPVLIARYINGRNVKVAMS